VEVTKPPRPLRSVWSQAITREDGAGIMEVTPGMVVGEGRGSRSGEEGGQAARGEDGLGRRRMVLSSGAVNVVRMVWGRWREERGEYLQVCVDMTSSLSGAASGVSISN
jgi:hypothetical protein